MLWNLDAGKLELWRGSRKNYRDKAPPTCLPETPVRDVEKHPTSFPKFCLRNPNFQSPTQDIKQ